MKTELHDKGEGKESIVFLSLKEYINPIDRICEFMVKKKSRLILISPFERKMQRY